MDEASDIHADSIREIEKMITDSSEIDLCRKINGKQDVKVYLRSLQRIIEELVRILAIEIRSCSSGENFVSKRRSLLVCLKLCLKKTLTKSV
jgi:hypothetical protein